MSNLNHILLPIFFDEAEASFELLEQFFAAEPAAQRHLEEAIRAVHTVKGAAALVKLDLVSALASRLEGAFDALSLETLEPPENLFPSLREAFELLRKCCTMARDSQPLSGDVPSQIDRIFAPFAHWIDLCLAPVGHSTDDGPELARPEYQSCCFRLGRREYYLPIEDMVEIADPSRLAAIPLAPPYVRGLIVHRGEAVAVIDLSLLEAEAIPDRLTDADWLVVAARGGQRLAFMAQGVPGLESEFRGELVDMGQFLHRYRVGVA